MRLRLTAVVCVLLLVSACGTVKIPQGGMTIMSEKTITGDMTIYQLETDDEKIYVADIKNARLYVLDQSLEVITSFLEKGNGPGEVGQGPMGPPIFSIGVRDDGNLVINDMTNMRYHVYTPDGKYVDTFNTGLIANRIKPYGSKLLANVNPAGGRKELLSVYDPETDSTTDTGYPVKFGDNMMVNIYSSLIDFTVRDDVIYVCFFMMNKVAKYSIAEKKLIAETELPGLPGDVKIDVDIRKNRMFSSQIRLKDDKVYILAHDMENIAKPDESKSYIYILDDNMKPVKRYLTETPISGFVVNGDDTITGYYENRLIKMSFDE